MRKLRLSKWDLTGVTVALLLFAGVSVFRAYIVGDISSHYCPIHGTKMRRVRITSDQSKFPSPQYVEFGLPGLDYGCVPSENYNSIKELKTVYLYCPDCVPKIGERHGDMCQ